MDTEQAPPEQQVQPPTQPGGPYTPVQTTGQPAHKKPFPAKWLAAWLLAWPLSFMLGLIGRFFLKAPTTQTILNVVIILLGVYMFVGWVPFLIALTKRNR